MTTWILLLAIWAGPTGTSAALTALPFGSQAACEITGQAAMKKWGNWRVSYLCVEVSAR
jgi:hypothetical protein